MTAPSSPGETRVAAYAVIVQQRGLLLAHWRVGEHGQWTLPGGGLDPGEAPADAAVREVREETGYDCALSDLLRIVSWTVPGADRLDDGPADLHALAIVYRAYVIGGQLRDEIDGSTDAARWVPLDEVALLDRVPLVDRARRLAGLL